MKLIIKNNNLVRKINITILIITIITIFSNSDNANSQNKNNDDNKIVKQLNKITVTGNKNDGKNSYKINSNNSSTRTNTKIINIPQAITIIGQQQISDQRITNISDALRYVPGVNIQQGESNRDQITIRGNSTNSDFFIDAARDDMQYIRDVYNIEKIEFLKGPNALAFGRGGSGGVVNRVSKNADGSRKRKIAISGGSFDNRRFEGDIGDKISNKTNMRLNAFYEKSGTFRQFGNLEKSGLNPTVSILLDDNTNLDLGYEFFSDERFNDRGIPSQNSAPYQTKSNKFFGNPNQNESKTKIHSGYAIVKHNFNDDFTIKNHTRFARNDKYYQNVYTAGAVDNSGNISLKAYGNDQERDNFTNQTDINKKFKTANIKHNLLLGQEITKQYSSVIRNTGFFNNNSKTQNININNSIDFTPITYRQDSSDDFDNNSIVSVYGLYLQDQIEFNRYLQIVGGVRYDNFKIDFKNKMNDNNFRNNDDLISPRFGIILKPKDNISIYSNYNVSYLPSSGEQFNNITSKDAFLNPEKFTNYEIGAKWDINDDFNISSAIYRLDRSNSKANDPNNAGLLILTGESRTTGFEISANGKINDHFELIAGYSSQNAEITKDTQSASKGKKNALTPKEKISFWNKYNLNKQFSVALGMLNQSHQFTSVDNNVKLKGFTRFDFASYYQINKEYRLQINVENILNRKYIETAHNNNNIQPASPIAFRLGVVANF